MSGAAVHVAEHAAVEGGKKPAAAAATEDNNPAVEEDKKQAGEEDKKAEGEVAGTHINFAKEKITSSANTLDGQELQQLGGAEKTKVPVDTEEPTSEGGGAMINKEQTHLLAVAEEDDASKELQLKKKNEKKRKRSELEQIKKEQRLGGAEKTKVLVDIEEPASETCCPQRWRASYSLLTIAGRRTKKERRDEKNRKRLKKELNKKMLRSPHAKLVRSSIGMFARVASLRKEMSPQTQQRKSESPSVPNVTVHFPSPNPPRVEADFTRGRPRKLKSKIWKDFIPLYEHGKLAEGQCKHCNEVFPASKTSGTNHIHRTGQTQCIEAPTQGGVWGGIIET